MAESATRGKPDVRRTTTLLLVSVLLGIVAAATVNAAEVTHYQSRGAGASAGGYSSDGCIDTGTSVSVADMTSKVDGPPTESTNLFINISEWDSCNFLPLRNIFATVSLGPNEFVGSKKLDGATLATSVSAYDDVTSSNVTLTLNLDWVGGGDISRGMYQNNNWFGWIFIRNGGSGSYRQATLSGTISDGLTDYAVGSPWGNLWYSTNSSLTVMK